MKSSKIGKLLVLMVFLFSVVMPFKGNINAEINSLHVSGVNYIEEAGYVELRWRTVKTFEMKDDEESLIIYKNGQAYPLESLQTNYMEDAANGIFADYQSEDKEVHPGESNTYQIQLIIGDKTFTSEEYEVIIPEDALAAQPEETESTTSDSTENAAQDNPANETEPSPEELPEDTYQDNKAEEGLFADNNLKHTVRQQLGIYDRALTEEDLLELPRLQISNAIGPVADFSGLEKAVNLESIEFNNQNVDNIVELKSMTNIKSLRLINSSVQNLEELLTFDNLERITYIGESPSYEDFDVYKQLLLQGKDVWIDQGSWLEYETSVNGTDITLDLSHTGQQEITAYEMYLNGELLEEVSYQKELQYTFEGLEPYTEYDLIIIPKDQNGISGIVTASQMTLDVGMTEEDINFEENPVEVQVPDWRDNPTGEVVSFEDEDLENGVRQELSIPSRQIYTSDMEHLQYLYLSHSNIASLAGLESAVNVVELYLGGNDISDLTPLEGMDQLQNLYLTDNNLEDLSPLSSMAGLTNLYLDNNPVSSIDSLKGLNQLVNLSINGTNLSAIAVLSDMTSLQSFSAEDSLYLEDNENNREIIASLEDRGTNIFVNLKKAYLTLDNRKVSDSRADLSWYGLYHETPDYYILTAGSKEFKLEGDAREFTLEELSPSSEYHVKVEAYKADTLIGRAGLTLKTKDQPSGEVVSFADKDLEEVVKAELLLNRNVYETDMKNLESLMVDSDISSLEGLEFATNLKGIIIEDSDVTDLSYIRGAGSLETLILYNVPVKDLSFVKNFTALRDLHLESVKVDDYSFLSELQDLTYLTIRNSGLKELPEMPQTNLSDVNLEGNNLTNVDSIQRIDDYGYLNIGNNDITNIDSLSELNLNFLGINGNPVENINTTFDNVFSVRIGDNSFDPVIINKAFPSVENLTIKGDLTSYQALTNIESSLRRLTIQDTTMDSIEFLKDMNTSYIVIGNTNENLSFKEGTEERRVKEELEAEGVYLEINSFNEIKITKTEVGADTLKVNWSYDGYEEADKFRLSLNRQIIDEVAGDVLSYKFTDLEPERNYELMIHVFGQDGYLWETYDNYTTLAVGEEITEEPNKETDEESKEEQTEASEEEESTVETPQETTNNETIPEKTTVKKVKAKKNAGKYVVDNTELKEVEEKSTVSIEVAKEAESSVQMSQEQVDNLQKLGASVEVDNTDVKVKIPAINLPAGKNAEITVKAMEAEGALAAYDFTISAEGETYHQFDEKMTLEFSVDISKVKKPENLRVFYFNEDTEEWELIGGTFAEGKVTAETDHFSTYGVFEVSDEELQSGKTEKTAAKPVAAAPQQKEQNNTSETAEKEEEKSEETTETETVTEQRSEQASGALTEEKAETKGGELPDTGTDLYKLLLIGTLLTATSLLLVAFRRKQA